MMATQQILFLSKGEDSASTRYRAFSYFPALTMAGWHPSHLSFHTGLIGKLRILQAARRADVVVVLRHGLSLPFLPLLRQFSKKLIFDFDDAVFVKSNGESSSVRGERFEKTVTLCDQVWAGNHYLAERARRINPHVCILPTAIDMVCYTSTSNKPSNFIDLVWIGSSSTRKYLEALLPTLEKAVKIEPRLRLKIIADFTLPSKILTVIPIPWHHDTEVHELQSAHIGIAPMPDTPWTRGKCALKVLQYMACHLPVISSKAGANAEIIQHNQSGLLVSAEAEWIKAITTLATQLEEQTKMGNAGYVICEEQFSLTACSKQMLLQLETLL